jgi:hypothetical protein
VKQDESNGDLEFTTVIGKPPDPKNIQAIVNMPPLNNP